MGTGTVLMLAVLVVALGFGVVALVARRRGSVRLGFGLREGGGREFAAGLALAAVAFVAIFAVELAAGAITVDGAGPDAATLGGGVVVLLALAVYEEVVFRVLLLTGLVVTLRRYVPRLAHPSAVAVALATVLVVLDHAVKPGVGPLTVLSAALSGVTYGLAYVRTGRLWLPLGLHVAWNVVQGPVLGFAVSGTVVGPAPVVHQHATGPSWLTGGAYGPEGGVVAISARVLIVVVLVALYRRRTAPGHRRR